MPAFGLLGGGILHGDLVVRGKDGKPVEVVVQRGTVTSVSGGTLVVHSTDGFDQTWTTGKDTRYVLGGAFARGPWMHARPGASGLPPRHPVRQRSPRHPASRRAPPSWFSDAPTEASPAPPWCCPVPH